MRRAAVVVGSAITLALAGCGAGASGGGSGGGGAGGSGGAGQTGMGGASGSGGAVGTGGATGGGGAGPLGTGGGTGGGAGGGQGGQSGAGGQGGVGGATAFTLTSPALTNGGMFPTDATCETSQSASQMPALMWTGVRAGTMSFAMVFVDATLVGMTPPNANGFHSAAWDIPASVRMLPQGLPAGSPPTGVAGLETVKQKKAPSGMAWLGPCPNFPSTTRTRTDTYEFRLYALSQPTLPTNTASMTVQQIQSLIEGQGPLGRAVLTGISNAAGTTLK